MAAKIKSYNKGNKKDCILNICSQDSDINDSNFVKSSFCLLSTSNLKFCKKKPKRLENSQLLRKT